METEADNTETTNSDSPLKESCVPIQKGDKEADIAEPMNEDTAEPDSCEYIKDDIKAGEENADSIDNTIAKQDSSEEAKEAEKADVNIAEPIDKDSAALDSSEEIKESLDSKAGDAAIVEPIEKDTTAPNTCEEVEGAMDVEGDIEKSNDKAKVESDSCEEIKGENKTQNDIAKLTSTVTALSDKFEQVKSVVEECVDTMEAESLDDDTSSQTIGSLVESQVNAMGLRNATDEEMQAMVEKAFEQLKVDDVIEKHFSEQMTMIGAFEREVAEISQMFTQCQAMIKEYREAEEKKVKAEAQKVESDSDDDVQIVETTYEAPKDMLLQRIKASLPSHLKNVVHMRTIKNASGQVHVVCSIPPSTPNYEFLKQELVRYSKHPQGLRNIVKNTNQQVKKAPIVYPDLIEGSRVYGKKHTDIWHLGVIVEVQNKHRPKSEQRFKVKFEAKGIKLLTAKHIAFQAIPPEVLPVGNRVIALYKDDGHSSYYAGIVAESPNVKNKYRYLIFFDDGYAQYSAHTEIHKVYEQSKNVWEDCYDDSKAFIEGYLREYPERPMVRLHPGQKVKTEWNTKWILAKVETVDASLVRMQFEHDRRTWTEWIYRGSTRLEPLYTELAQQEKLRQRGLQGTVSRRHINATKRKHVVEYLSAMTDPTDGNATGEAKKKSVAKKSTSKKPQHTGKGDIASVLQERLSLESPEQDGHVRADNKVKSVQRRKFVKHRCNRSCLNGLSDDPTQHRLSASLLIPQYFGWERRQCWKKASSVTRMIVYRAPCGRLLRTLDEVDRYLALTNSRLTIDMFSMDSAVRSDTEFISTKTFCDIKDLSYGKEKMPISCVNSFNRQYPEYVEYSTERVPGKGVNMGRSSEYRVGCNCTDGCRDPTKCACIQLTIEASKILPGNETDSGYYHRRLLKSIPTGVYECNANCGCDSRCANRVVQGGLRQRLQVFRTENKGWGIRALNDIDQGSFLCTYSGQLLSDQVANEDGQQFGDEYLAELDYIETVEGMKEGYESEVIVSSDDDTTESVQTESETSSPAEESDCSVGKVVDRKLGLNKKRKRKKKDKKNELPNTPQDCSVISLDDSDDEKKLIKEENMGGISIGEAVSMNTDNVSVDTDDEDSKNGAAATGEKKRGPRRSTRGDNIKMPDPSQPAKQSHNKKPLSLRSYYNEEFCYVMDAKSKGNIGRYLNHGCSPNVFVQNVFVDSHDLRFPWVAFFAERTIKAGQELTWDYNYEVGSVQGKTLYCYCGSTACRGRLL